MKQKIILLFLSFVFVGTLTANAQELPQNTTSSVINAYRFYKDIDSISIKVPTVVEIPFADEFIERFSFAVLNKDTSSWEPHFFKQETLVNKTPVTVSTRPNVASASLMNDNDTQTYADFPLLESTRGIAQIILLSANQITASSLTVLLDSNVVLPNFIEISAEVDGQERIVVASRRMDQQTVSFPQTTSSRWTITFIFSQPLRISELQLHQDNASKNSTRAIRFLAHPSHSYRIYFDPDRTVSAPVGEAGNLIYAKDFIVISSGSSQNNPDYIIADVDGDGVLDTSDNCVSIANLDQKDLNNNGIGDACDDFDQDGIINNLDNCLNNPNVNQKDMDSDGIGDVCDKIESRITERYTWIPWVGIGFAALVLVSLLFLTARLKPTKTSD